MVSVQWYAINSDSLPNLIVRQVYCWTIDALNRVTIVSKNSTDWQLPGGKPERGEPLIAALIREVYEETGIDLERLRAKPELFGYYVVTNDPSYAKDYMQLRYYIRVNKVFKNLEPGRNNNFEEIKHVKSVSTAVLLKIIPWIGDSGEYRQLASMGKLDES